MHFSVATAVRSLSGPTYRHLDEQTITVLPFAMDACGNNAVREKRGSLKTRGWFASTVTVLGAALASQVHAQNPADTPVNQLEQVVVTAQRREESILETPVTVTAIGGDILKQQNVQELTDLVPLTPGLEIEPDAGRTAIRLRGIATSDGSPASENTTALHVDNIYLSHRAALDGYFYDVDRVEVLQGPQGTLYGRNTAAGSINIISRRPVQKQQGSVEVEFGTYGHRRVQGMLNVPITDTLAVRSAFQSTTNDGYFDSGIDANRSTYGRLSAQWNPTDRVSVYAKLDFGDSRRQGVGTALLGVVDNTNPDHWTLTRLDEDDGFNDRLAHPRDASAAGDAIDQSFISNKFWGVMTEITFDLTDNTQFIVNAARIEEKNRSRTVNEEGEINAGGLGYNFFGGPADDRRIGRPWVENVLDARFQGVLADQLDWTVGYFRFKDDTNEPEGNATGVAFNAPISLSESDAYYGQVTWTPPAIDRLHITVGGRHTEDWKKWDFQVVLFDSFVVGGSGGVLEKDWENDDWKVGLAWDLSDSSLLYANAATGYRSGSWYPGPLPQYGPEHVDAYELGWKGRFLNNRLDLVANAYYYEYSDMAIGFDALNTLSGEYEASMFNLGLAEITGFNIGGTWLVTDTDRLAFNLDYTDSEIKEFDFAAALAQFGPQYNLDAAFDWTGLALPNTTPWRLTLAWNHTFNLGKGTLDSRLQSVWNDARYEGYRETTQVQYEFAGYRIDSYFTLDWNLIYQPGDAQWHAGLYVTNITDEIVPNSLRGGDEAPEGTLAGTLPANQAYLTGTLRAPREFGIRFGLDF